MNNTQFCSLTKLDLIFQMVKYSFFFCFVCFVLFLLDILGSFQFFWLAWDKFNFICSSVCKKLRLSCINVVYILGKGKPENQFSSHPEDKQFACFDVAQSFKRQWSSLFSPKMINFQKIKSQIKLKIKKCCDYVRLTCI